MHIMADPADGESLHLILPRNAAEVRPEPFADGGGEKGSAFLGGEHTMHQAGVERVHGVQTDLFIENSPAIYGWVKYSSFLLVPSGTRELLGDERFFRPWRDLIGSLNVLPSAKALGYFR